MKSNLQSSRSCIGLEEVGIPLCALNTNAWMADAKRSEQWPLMERFYVPEVTECTSATSRYSSTHWFYYHDWLHSLVIALVMISSFSPMVISRMSSYHVQWIQNDFMIDSFYELNLFCDFSMRCLHYIKNRSNRHFIQLRVCQCPLFFLHSYALHLCTFIIHLLEFHTHIIDFVIWM